MKRPYGLSFEMADAEDGSRHFYLGRQKFLHVRPTYIKDGVETNAERGGFKFDINIGTMCRPLPKFWKKAFWYSGFINWWHGREVYNAHERYMMKEPTTNPWNSGNHWKVIRFPFIGFFVSCYIVHGEDRPGFYLGFKTYMVDKISQALGLYFKGSPEIYLEKAPYPDTVAWGKKKWSGDRCLCISGTARKNMMH